MRIGELAALVGVSTRTVRHYHHLGLLPEPVRLANGYREYRLRDAVALARVRRLAELGLSLDEIRDVLADDRDRELREVLVELDADLAGQQEAIALRRARLAALLAEADLHPDSAVSPDMTAVLRDLHAEGSAFAAADREMLALMDTVADPAERDRMLEMMRPLTEPGALARSHALYARLDELAGADPGDPRVPALAADLAAHIPAELAAVMIEHLPASADPSGSAPGGGAAAPRPGPRDADGGVWFEALSTELPPAQAEVLRLMAAVLKERT
ncbi:MerR family transcriptional regulator [Planomonospora venezuelensis]|uniref:DNA-binding transcriptional MerR regulator n=1 Tax=Planomonospora venezuelensis TaxID=1999 RepID=A0A841D4W8_PLAVE|nr:MerR family transcriptional regulator [Planomonospora venezuelensis]MBB5964900.1 DNA-binding transcriptional MerR regulator [Planomonospora venezuelensis]GIM99488.1 MerR family transcriptional regulator [Planomonospora venezuelensis]